MVTASTGASDLVAVSHSSGVMFDFSLTGKLGSSVQQAQQPLPAFRRAESEVWFRALHLG